MVDLFFSFPPCWASTPLLNRLVYMDTGLSCISTTPSTKFDEF